MIIDVNELSEPAISVFVNTNGEVLTDKNNAVDIIDQLIINCEKQVDFIEELNRAAVRVEVERVMFWLYSRNKKK